MDGICYIDEKTECEYAIDEDGCLAVFIEQCPMQFTGEGGDD